MISSLNQAYSISCILKCNSATEFNFCISLIMQSKKEMPVINGQIRSSFLCQRNQMIYARWNPVWAKNIANINQVTIEDVFFITIGATFAWFPILLQWIKNLEDRRWTKSQGGAAKKPRGIWNNSLAGKSSPTFTINNHPFKGEGKY